MMRGRDVWAVAVRRPAGDLHIESHDIDSVAKRHPILAKPFIRGVIALGQALGIGFRALSVSARESVPEDERLSSRQMGLSMAIAAVIFIGLFVVLPAVAFRWVGRSVDSSILVNALEGVFRVALFLGYLLLIGRTKDIRRVFQYHGAEHKTIAAYEHEEPLVPERVDGYSTLHVRCGTNFLLLVMVITIFVFALFGNPGLWWRIAVADHRDPDHRGDRVRAAAARRPVPALEGDPRADGAGAVAAEDHHEAPRSRPDRGRDRVVQRGAAPRVGADAGHVGTPKPPHRGSPEMLASRAHGCSLRDPPSVRGGFPMSTTNLDLPVLISAEQIRRREFVTIRRGYDPDQVRAYLEQLADQIELMRVLLRDAQAEAQTALRRTTAQPRHDPYQQLGERVASVIREADQVAETIKTEAHRDAELVTRDARAEADRIRTDAQSKAEDARSQAETAVRAAREEADRTIAGLSTRRDALVDQLASMQERLIGVARDLESAMDVQVDDPGLRLDQGPSRGVRRAEGSMPTRTGRTGRAVGRADRPRPRPISRPGPSASAVREPTIVVGEADDVADDDGAEHPRPLVRGAVGGDRTR